MNTSKSELNKIVEDEKSSELAGILSNEINKEIDKELGRIINV